MSGIDFNSLSDKQKQEINSLPAMIYHGVNTSEAVLMRMNNVPRSIAQQIGEEYSKVAKEHTVQEAREFIKSLTKHRLAHHYHCSSFSEFLDQMSNCLETDINESNYRDNLAEFVKCYNSWTRSHQD